MDQNGTEKFEIYKTIVMHGIPEDLKSYLTANIGSEPCQCEGCEQHAESNYSRYCFTHRQKLYTLIEATSYLKNINLSSVVNDKRTLFITDTFGIITLKKVGNRGEDVSEDYGFTNVERFGDLCAPVDDNRSQKVKDNELNIIDDYLSSANSNIRLIGIMVKFPGLDNGYVFYVIAFIKNIACGIIMRIVVTPEVVDLILNESKDINTIKNILRDNKSSLPVSELIDSITRGVTDSNVGDAYDKETFITSEENFLTKNRINVYLGETSPSVTKNTVAVKPCITSKNIPKVTDRRIIYSAITRALERICSSSNDTRNRNFLSILIVAIMNAVVANQYITCDNRGMIMNPRSY